MIPSNPNPTTTESARPTIPNQVQGGYAPYTPEYAFATLPGPALVISMAPNISTLQRPPIQALPRGSHPQGAH